MIQAGEFHTNIILTLWNPGLLTYEISFTLLLYLQYLSPLLSRASIHEMVISAPSQHIVAKNTTTSVSNNILARYLYSLHDQSIKLTMIVKTRN